MAYVDNGVINNYLGYLDRLLEEQPEIEFAIGSETYSILDIIREVRIKSNVGMELLEIWVENERE